MTEPGEEITQEHKDMALMQIASAVVTASKTTGDERIAKIAAVAVEQVKANGGVEALLTVLSQCQSQLASQPDASDARRTAAEEARSGFQDALKQRQETQTLVMRQMSELMPQVMQAIIEGQNNDGRSSNRDADADENADGAAAVPGGTAG